MPFDEYPWIPSDEILTFEEIARLANIAVRLGVEKIRLTGGEPLVRPHLEQLIRYLSALPGVEELCLTTNASLLAEKAVALKSAGLTRINVSLDTLDPEKFKRIRRRGDLSRVLEGLFSAKRCGFDPIKINAVIERGVNDDDIVSLVEFSRDNGFAVRFIEYMDVGNSNAWKSEKVVPKREILETINAFSPLREVGRDKGSAPAVDYEFIDGGGHVGVIASVTEPFCSTCTRARLTADGKLVTCLFSDHGRDLRALLRDGATDDDLGEAISAAWRGRADRYSDERLRAMSSPGGYQSKDHRKIEMITLGG